MAILPARPPTAIGCCTLRWNMRTSSSNRFLAMRKHLGWYARGVHGAHGLRRELVETYSADEVAAILDHYFAYRQAWERRSSQTSI